MKNHGRINKWRLGLMMMMPVEEEEEKDWGVVVLRSHDYGTANG